MAVIYAVWIIGYVLAGALLVAVAVRITGRPDEPDDELALGIATLVWPIILAVAIFYMSIVACSTAVLWIARHAFGLRETNTR